MTRLTPIASGARALLSRLLGPAVMLLVGACSPTQILNSLSPNGARLETSIPYGAGERRTLDVYAPEGARRAPVVVFFYGGSWQGGSKAMYRFVAAALADRGIVVVLPDYRVSPEVRFPGFVEDGALAFAWTKANIARFGGDSSRVILMGHSAGAHIAAMLAFDERWLRGAGLRGRADVAAFIGLAGPYDFLPIRAADIKEVFAGSDPAATQPINFVGRNEPPSFLGYASSDSLVEPGNSQRLGERLRRNGNRVAEKAYSGVNHLTLIGAFAPPLRFLAPVRDDVVAFISTLSGAMPLEGQPDRP